MNRKKEKQKKRQTKTEERRNRKKKDFEIDREKSIWTDGRLIKFVE